MSHDENKLIQEALVQRDEKDIDPEYKRLLKEYSDNPFFDLTKDRIKDYVESKEGESDEKPTETI